jgi:hypothetical protein
MVGHAGSREAEWPGKPGKPVAGPLPPLIGSLEEAVWSLAYACGGGSAEAERARELFGRAAREGDFALLFRRWWQEKTLAPLPAGAVVAPWATGVHQRIAERLATWQLLGQEPLLLPCSGCGRVFMSRSPRFARSCGRCKPYAPAGPSDPDGSRVMVSAGFYPAGPYGPSRGQSILCAHPDCLRLVLATSSQRRYCDQHQHDRKSAARARGRVGDAKHARIRFYPAAGSGELQVGFIRRGGNERRLALGPDGYQARDEQELIALLQLRQSGRIELR